MTTLKQEKARFDTRLSKEQKLFFERAARLGGYRNLTDFVIMTLQKRAKEIINERENIIASQKDKEVFFDAIMNPAAPNENLISAVKDYNKMIP